MRLKSPAPTDGAPASPAEKPTAYRTIGSLATGGLLVIFGVIFLFAFGLSSESHPVGVVVGLLMIVGGVVGGIYPAAFSYGEQLVIRNPFRRIEIAWPRVESVSARLSMVVETLPEEGRRGKYTIWAIPVSMHERRKSDRAAAKQARQAKADAARAASRAGDVGGYGSMRARHHDPVESLAFADQAVAEMRDRQRACSTPVEQAKPTAVTWTWYTVGPFAVAVALLVAAIAGAF
ncbi:MAG: hypothetical protein HOV87_27050 [Catenulispora sp.]|nr:hypothetical protein [Catenulispora sp.]